VLDLLELDLVWDAENIVYGELQRRSLAVRDLVGWLVLGELEEDLGAEGTLLDEVFVHLVSNLYTFQAARSPWSKNATIQDVLTLTSVAASLRSLVSF
jgi:hypothetical protein